MKRLLTFLMVALLAMSMGYAQQSKSAKENETPATKSVTLPWTESFTGETFPPEGWNLHTLGYQYNTFMRASWGSYSDPGCAYHSSTYGGTARNNWLVSPAIQLPATGSYTLKFWTKFESTYSYESSTVCISTGSNDPTSSDFTVLKTWTQSEVGDLYNWTEFTLPLNAYLGQQIYIGFRYTAANGTNGFYWYLDDIKVSEPAVNDLGAVSVSGGAIAPTGVPAQYAVTVKNFGSATQTNYTVNLKKQDGTLLASVPGTAIAFGETKPYQLNWTPTTAENTNIYGEVVLSGDQDPSNDKTSNYPVLVYNGNITLPYTMGFEDSDLWQIWTNKSEVMGNSWSRYGYYDAYQGDYSMAHINNNTSTPANSWLFSPALSLNGTKAYKVSFYGKNAYEYYNDQKLALCATSAPSPEAVVGEPFWVNENVTETNYTKFEGIVSGLNGSHHFALHLFSGPGTSTFNVDNFRIEEVTSVKGAVTSSGSPLAGVIIEVTGLPNKAYTDATGNYVFGLEQLGTYTFKASKPGYSTDTKTVNVTSFNQTINFSITPSANYTVSGKVTGNDTGGAGLQGVAITISGYGDPHSAITNASGSFSIPGVFDGHTYTITATLAGRMPYSGEITLNGANLIHNITLNEICNPVSDVTVNTPSAATPNAVITWTAPVSGKGGEKSLTGYNVYRLLKGAPETEWTQIQTNISTLTYTDNNVWNTLPYGTYQYAVKAVYTGSVLSTAALSNDMLIRTSVTYTINITTNGGQIATGAYVTLKNQNGQSQYIYTGQAGATGITFNEVWKGTYDLTITLAGYQNYSTTGIDITQDNPAAHQAVLVEVLYPVPNTVFAEPNETLTEVKVSWEAPTGKSSRSLTGYDVYRVLGTESTLVAENTPNLFYNELATHLENGKTYHWEVKAVYSGNYQSAARYSNNIVWGSVSTVYVNISTNGGDPVTGAHVTLSHNTNTIYVYNQTITENNVVFKGVFKGSYTLNIELEGYQTYTTTVPVFDAITTLNPVVLIENMVTPFNLEVAEIGTCEHKFIWNKIKTADITVTTGNNYGDGTGFQMWLDETATLYGTPALPAIGAYQGYGTCSSVSQSTFDLFSHKVPEDAYLSCSTTPASNWVMGRSVTIQIPAGIYDYTFVYIRYGTLYSSNNANATCKDGTNDNFEFEAGKKYTFTCTNGWSDDFCMTVENGKNTRGKNFIGYKIYIDNVFVAMTLDPEYTFTDLPAGIHVAGVQGVYSSGVTEIVTFEFESTCTATLPTYTIEANSNNNAWGSVTGGNTFTKYETVTLTATAEEEYEFVKWTENGEVVSTENPFVFAAIADMNLVGNFMKTIIYYNIDATSNNSAWGTVTGGGKYEENTPVTLTANPAVGYEFVNWTENGEVVSTANPLQFSAEVNRTLVGNFKKTTYTIEGMPNNSAWGSVTGSGIYNYNVQVTLKGVPEAGYEVANWTENGEEVSTAASYVFTATANRTLVCNFAKIPELFSVTFNVVNKTTQEVITGAEITLNNVTQTGNYIFSDLAPETYTYTVKADLYQTVTKTVVVDGNKTVKVELDKLGIISNTLSGLELYPNPFYNEIRMSNPELVKSIVITDILGQKVNNVLFDGKKISTGDFTDGIYLITIESITGDKVVQKMVKK